MAGGSSVADLVGDAAFGGLAVLGPAAAMAMGATYVGAACSISLAMQNATANQQRVQVTANAAITIAVARILAAPFKKGSSP